MTRGGFASFGIGFFVTFGISKLAGAKTGNALLAGAAVGIVLSGTFEVIALPIIEAKAKKQNAQVMADFYKNLNQAQADYFAQRIQAVDKGKPIIQSDVFDKAKLIEALSLGNYSYKDGKAVKNK